MKLFEINDELVVLATDDKNTTLENPKTKVKTAHFKRFRGYPLQWQIH